jgi:hypothetical protein
MNLFLYKHRLQTSDRIQTMPKIHPVPLNKVKITSLDMSKIDPKKFVRDDNTPEIVSTPDVSTPRGKVRTRSSIIKDGFRCPFNSPKIFTNSPDTTANSQIKSASSPSETKSDSENQYDLNCLPNIAI